MKVTVDITQITAYDLFDSILKKEQNTNLFKDLRKVFSNRVKEAIVFSGIHKVEHIDRISAKISDNGVLLNPIPTNYNSQTLDIEFCSGYGIDYYSLTAINYLHGYYTELPSLDTFFKRKTFSIGNFGFLIPNGDYEIELLTNSSIKLVGYSSQISSKKKKSFVAILGVHFDENAMQEVFKKYYVKPDKNELIDISLNTIHYPSLFLCKRTGSLYVCNCFKEYIDWESDFNRFANINEDEISKRIKNIEHVNGICHLCTKTVPNTATVNSEYSSFIQKYLPYYRRETKKRFGTIFHFNKEDNVRIENDLREYFGYPRIGEKWVSETQLYYLIKEIYPGYKSVFHYRGREMEGLELDIFIPELSLGFEYQGKQHYSEVEHWGGKTGLEKRKLNDIRKVDLCKENNYRLIEFYHTDELNKDLVIERIEQAGLPTN